ncbi:sensor domain-containing diguanylate cyclase [Comamonas sp. NoAH]|uniref:bifunctional diguanylate cyclase/phosphodiesterase n=1 Tax=Comamonas halotolerans TaxID=3041496 RepID=UPI0024E08738|nr:sensor domain-containing diguanylate cyclase [Comamonas sp. NoAH]
MHALSPLRSLKLSLLLPYAALITLLIAVISVMVYWAGAQAVTRLSDLRLTEMVQRMQQEIENHVSGSAAVLEAAFPSGTTAPSDIRRDWQALRNRLWTATSLHPLTNDYVHYGNVSGQGVGLKRLPDGSAQLRVRTSSDQHRHYYSLASIDGEQQFLRTERTMFDPRNRPWFQLALHNEQQSWSSVYIDLGIQDLVLTRARRILNDQGNFEGVIATDVPLRALNAVVDEIGRSVQGLAFVVEPSGDLVAISGMSNLRLADEARVERITTYSSGNSLAHSIYLQTRSYFNPSSTTSNNADKRSLSQVSNLQICDTDGQSYHVAFVRVDDRAGLDWIAAVAVPRASLLADVVHLVKWVILVGAFSLLLALLIGMHLFGRLAGDLRSLSHTLQRVGHGDISTPFEIQRNDEVGELARNFNSMRHALFTDRLTGVANRSALQHMLGSWIVQAHTAPSPTLFALLFIDLNHFKPLNDRWGHDNGDLALIEVAQRMRHHLGGEDLVARLGGDEFVVVLHGVDNMGAAQDVCTELEALISAPLTTLRGIPEDTQVSVGASIGIALFPQDAQDVQGLLKHADQQMYAQKGKKPFSYQRE